MSNQPTYYERAAALGATPDVLTGLDLLLDDGMDPEKAAQWVVAAQRDGEDAEAAARHLLKLRRAFRSA